MYTYSGGQLATITYIHLPVSLFYLVKRDILNFPVDPLTFFTWQNADELVFFYRDFFFFFAVFT